MLGDYLETIHRDFEKARKVYQSTCDDYGYAKSCLKYGHYTFIGRGKSGSKPNPTEALQYYEKGCILGDGENCLNAGLLLVSPKMNDRRNFLKVKFLFTFFSLIFLLPIVYVNTMSLNINCMLKFQGMEYLTKSCDMNNGNACFYLSGMHISGAEGPIASVNDSKPFISSSSETQLKKPVKKTNDFIIQKDMEKAFTFTYKACELNNMYACANLSQMYARGEGTEKNPEKADIFKKKAIELQDEIKNTKTLAFQQ